MAAQLPHLLTPVHRTLEVHAFSSDRGGYVSLMHVTSVPIKVAKGSVTSATHLTSTNCTLQLSSSNSRRVRACLTADSLASYYAVYSGNSLLMFQDNLSVLPSRLKNHLTIWLAAFPALLSEDKNIQFLNSPPTSNATTCSYELRGFPSWLWQ